MHVAVAISILLLTVPAVLLTRYLTNLRKRAINTQELNRSLRSRLEASLKAEQTTHRNLQEKLSRVEEEYKRIEKELEQKANEEEDRRRIQKEKEKQELTEREIREKAEKETIERLETERLQLEKRLSQAAEEAKHFVDEWRKEEAERDRIGEEHRKLQEREKHWQTEREERDRLEKEATERFESQIQELEGKIHNANEERNFLKETIRELIKRIEDLHQAHASEKEQWRAEIEARYRTQQEMLEKFDTERRNLEEKLLDGEKERIRTEEEIRTEIKEKEELKRALNEKISELVTEHQHLREILFRTQNEYKRLEEETKLGEKEKELEILGDELKHLRGELSKSKEKRKRLANRLRAINPIHRGGRSRGPVNEKGSNGSEDHKQIVSSEEILTYV